jgi:hypothetical protein
MKGREKAAAWHFTSTTGYVLSVIALAAISIWIRTGFPVAVVSGIFDDRLFIRLANFLASGDWLGPYDHMTLAKGMFYSMFIACAHFLGLPLKIAEQIVYLAACLLTVELVRRRTKNSYFAIALFAVLALNPVVWHRQLSRVMREGLYLSLSPILLVLFVMVVFPAPGKSRFSAIYRGALGIGLGLTGAAYWLTREEGIWLLPALAVVGLLGSANLLWPHALTPSTEQDRSPRSTRLRALAVPLVLAILTFVAGDFLVAGLNYHYYGIFETNEFRAKSFLRAYGAVTRIRPNHWEPFVLFPKDARERGYAVSPAARELKPFLDGPLADSWRSYCAPCTEVIAGWFMWEFRGTVEYAGHYRTGRDAMNFYDTLANQINEACASGRIDCLPQRDALSPPFRAEYVGQSIGIAQGLAKAMFALRDEPVSILPSQGDPQSIAFYTRLVGPVTSTNSTLEGNRVIQGWAAAASAEPTVRLIDRGHGDYPSSATILPAEEIAVQYPGFKAIRFHIETDCPPTACDLVVSAPGSEPGGLPLSQVAKGRLFNSKSLMLAIQDVDFPDGPKLRNQSPQFKTASLLSTGYAMGFPIVSLLGFLGMVLAVAFRSFSAIPIELWALSLASIAAVITRIALLSYITATSFPAAHMLYASPATPFVIIFAAAGTYCGWSALAARYRRPEREPLQAQPGSSRVHEAVVSISD